MEHGVAAAAVLGEPGSAGEAGLFVALLGFSVAGAAEGALTAVVVDGQAGWPPAVLIDPVRDGVVNYLGPIAGLSETSPDLGGESLLHGRVPGRLSAPVQRSDQFGDIDGFGVGGSEQP
jgi:hypothetical protein